MHVEYFFAPSLEPTMFAFMRRTQLDQDAIPQRELLSENAALQSQVEILRAQLDEALAAKAELEAERDMQAQVNHNFNAFGGSLDGVSRSFLDLSTTLSEERARSPKRLSSPTKTAMLSS